MERRFDDHAGIMQDAELVDRIRRKYTVLAPRLDERLRRCWAAAEAESLGWGGVSIVAAATGLSRTTIRVGRRELKEGAGPSLEPNRVRRAGGGRKLIASKQPGLLPALLAMVSPATRGDPESPLRWICKSTRKLAAELRLQGFSVTDRSVAGLLKSEGFSLQANRKTKEGGSHPDRDAQFEHVARKTKEFQLERQPVISVDTKKKELVGEFKNAGREWSPQGEPEAVQVHDFPSSAVGKAIPYGVYDVARDEGWVSVGIDHDTARFAVASIRRWWLEMGAARHPGARRLMITADGGGSNASRSRLWKVALQELADELGLEIHVCHFPPGTSKWNKIEHCLFCYIAMNWRGRPLTTYETVVRLIGSATTASGLVVRAALDEAEYETGIKVTDAELAAVNLVRDAFHGDWNYVIRPRPA